MRIEIKNLNKSFGQEKVIEDLNLVIKDKERVALVGKSGIGKTTLLKIILGIMTSDSGEIKFSEEPKMSVVFQDNLLFENKTVYENILFVREIEREIVFEYLEKLKMADTIDKKISELSGGMKRRVALLRSIVYGGNIYIFDEVLREVDEDTKKAMIDLINNVDETMIFTTHNDDDIKALKADEIIVLKK